jgi:hypothetical protein
VFNNQFQKTGGWQGFLFFGIMAELCTGTGGVQQFGLP